jgi:transposase
MTDTLHCTDLTDAEWSLIEPLLSECPPGNAAGQDLRLVINGIFFLRRSGSALRTAPPWSTAESYYWQWQADGTWDRITATVQAVRSGWAPLP